MKKIIVALVITLTLLLAGNWQSVFADLKGIETTLTPNNQRDKFQTDLFTGSATYSYPISVPKGTNDLTPDVSLSYSSLGAHDGNYLAGNGWELNRDYIERDINYSPSNLSDDKFVLHFKGGAYDLVYSPADGTYHTKTETFAKIEKIALPIPTQTTAQEINRATGGTIAARGDNSGSGEGMDKAFDGTSSTKWLDFSSTSWIQYHFGGGNEYVISKYTITSANDYPERDPASWVLRGSHDGSNWTTLDTQTGQNFSGRFTKNTYTFSNTTAYGFYKLDNIVNHSGSIIQLSEIELIEVPALTPPPTQPATSDILTNFKGEYFNNTNWSGTPTLVRNDPEINFNWGNGSPDPSIQSDNFSVRWTKTVYLTGGSYTYSLHSDDSMQLLIDGTQVASSDPGSIGDTTTTVNLTTGNHTFQLLYIEWGGTAYAKFNPLHDGTYWRLTTKDGTQYEFGKSADSQLPCSTNTYTERWNIDQVTDTHNNAIYYTYTQDNAEIQGMSYLTKIQYNNDKSRSIVFNYQSNPYQRKQYIQGCLVTQPSNLQSIQVNAQNSLVHEYDLSYTQTTSNQPLLQSITEKGSDGSSLPPTTFNYKPQVNTWSTQQALWLNHASVDANLDKTDVFMYDVNGDGLVDILKTTRDNGNDTWAVLLNQGSGWSSNYQLWVDHANINANLDPYYQTNVKLADVTGDGLPDIVRSGSPWQVLRNTGTSWNTSWENWSNIPADLSDTKTKLIDVNGDGLADIVKSINNGNGTYTWQVFKNLGNNSWDTNGEYWVNSQPISADLSMTNVALSDVNGDGLPDIVRTTYNGDQYAINTPVTWYVYINTGSSWNTNAEIWVNNLPLGSHLQNPNSTISDVNGDGLPDIVRSIDYGTNDEWDALLNKGNSWDSAYTVFINPATQSLDLDAHNSNVRIVDVNGDGLPDLIKGSADCSCNEDTWMVWLNLGTSPDLLSSVHTPQGATVSFDYTPSTSFNNKGSDNVPDLGFPIWAVTKMTTDNGVSGSAHTNQSTTYSYANGLYSWLDKEFRGFGNVTENLPNGGQKQYVFNQDNALKGQLASETTSIYNGAPYEKSEYTWTSTQNSGVYIPLLQSEKHYTYDGVATNPKIIETDYQYDPYGNVTKKSDLGDINTNGDERYTYNDYIYNPTRWMVDKLAHTYTNGSDNSIKVAEQWEYYDNDPTATQSATITPTPTPASPFGDGSDGDITIATNTPESPIDSPVTATSGTNTAVVNAGVSFSPNQLVMLHQTQGTNAGIWELARVQSYSGTNLTFTSSLTNSYTSSGNNHAQIRVVPQYNNITVNANTMWSAKPWNGTTGGILAFLANGTVTVNGTISLSGSGFRGGNVTSGSTVGQQGESYSGIGTNASSANNSGGGGGVSSDNSGGGGGGHATAGTNGNAYPGGVNAGGAGGGFSFDNTNLSTMLLGSGGGGGHQIAGTGTAGGIGGGILFSLTRNLQITGTITTNGVNATNPIIPGGAGGAGAAGAILLRAQTATIGSNLVSAVGGAGYYDPYAGSGNGGNGLIRLEYLSSLSGNTSPTASTAQVTSVGSLPPAASPIVSFGDGSDGNFTVSADQTITPTASSVTAVAGNNVAAVSNGIGFVAGQIVLLHQTQGTNVGIWELARVQSYSNTTLTFTAPLTNSYSSNGGSHAQVLVVPQYHDVTINSGRTLYPNAWNGTTGGILAFFANGTVTNLGNIVADGSGFRGGVGGNFSPGTQGEGTSGPGGVSNNANGTAGGGGAEDTGNRESGGAGGGYATAGGSSAAAGGASGAVGGTTGGSADLSSALLGSAGGGGARANAGSGQAPTGGNGGGWIFITAANIDTTGNIRANGWNGGNGASGSEQSGSGAGSGGSVLLRVQSAAIGTNQITAQGGTGGTPGTGNGTSGGNGGDGKVAISYISSFNGSTLPSATVSQVSSFAIPPQVVNNSLPNYTLTKGDLTTETKWRNIGGSNTVTNYTYDSFGNQTSVTDANNHTTSFVYGLTDTTNTYPERVVNAKNQATNYSYSLGTGNLLSKIDPNGYTTTYIYDSFGRPATEIDPYDSSSFPTVSYQYFDTTSPQGKLVSRRTTAGSSNTYNTYTFTDGLGRTIQTRSDAQDPTKQIVTDIFYDPMGLVSSQTIPHLSTSYQSYAESGVGFPVVSSSYDILGRLVVFTNSDLTQKRTVYDHWTKTLIDENSHKTSQISDAYGKIVEVDEPSANGTGLPYSTYYQYDPNDELTKIVDNAGNNTTFTYDSLGNKISQLDPDLGTWNYTYDNVGNLVNQTDNRSITTVRTYDELNRLTKIHYPNDPDVLYSYDINTIGTLANKTDHAGTVGYAYDQRLRKTSETRIADGNSWTTGYTYDSADRLTSQTNPDGEIITYAYNPQGKIQSVGGVVTNIDYNAQGNVTGKTAPNGLTTTYTYDTKSFRLNKIQTGTLQNINYTYDNVGNVTSTKDNMTNVTQTFAYDFLNRLTNATSSDNSYSHAYVYDPIGNLIQFTNALNTVSYAYGQQAGVHALTSAGDAIPVSPTPSPSPTPTPPATTFGTGADGDITVASGQTTYTDNIRSGIATSVGAGQNVIQLNSSLGFLVGQEVFILQVQGTGAGTYEFDQVSGINGNSISLQNILSHSYLAGNNAASEIIVVPQYHDVTVQNGGTLTAHGWDGTSGGVSVFKATGTVQVDANGKIDVSSLGFRGGAGVNPNGRPGITQNQGESYMGIGIQSSDANLTAGGGGINDGGNRSGGGGGGGYATAGQVGTATGGSNPVSAPGNGGQTVGVDTLTSALFGGAGGAGAVYGTNTGNNGANGGGILFVTANTLSLNGGILANGGSGIASDGTHAGSGAGAGGSILIKAQNATLGSSNISAIGGLGGSGNGLAGAGGNGGAGRIRIEYYTSLSGSTSPSASVYQYGTTSEGASQTLATFGNGQDGDITISSDTTEAPIDSSVAATSGTISITVGSSLGFTSGQAVMFHQSQGVNAGTWELAKVQAYSGTTLTLTTPLVHSYSNTNGNQAQVRVVPQYHNVMVASGASWKPKLWNRNTGGILAFLANGTVTINGTIDARSAGFAGGLGSVGDNTTGVQGDSATGIGTSSTTNNGSGGGAAKKTFGSEASASGGGGNGTNGSNGTTFSGSTGGTGGSTAGSSDLSSMVFGGGSGGAGSIPNPALNGVAGGGIVMMNAANLVVNGNINLNGTTGISSGNVDQGVTGGSAGGSYYLKAQSATLGSNAITAVGGNGGTNTGGSAQVGGHGGDGRISILYGTLSGTTTPPASTIQDASLLNPPTATLSITPSSGFSPLAVTLDASGSTAGTAAISSYTFDFGDGSTPVTQSTPTIIHTYTTPGTYNATVTLTDAANLTATASQTITANASYTISGNVFTDLNTNGTQETGETNYQGATVTLSGAGSGTATSDASGNYSFTSLAAGNYTITLTLPSGYTATSTNPISVTLAANATANFGIVPICGGLIVTSALNLDASTITTGSTIHGSITYKNPCVTSYTANAIIIAARDGGNGNEDFQPYSGTVTLSAGQSITINTSKTIPTAGPIGQWYAFGSYEDTNNIWHGDSNQVNFTVVAPPVSSVSDNWSSGTIDTTKWNNWGSPQTSIMNNQLQISSVLGSSYYGIDSYNGFGQSLLGSSVTDQLVNAGNQSLTSWEVYPIVILKNDDFNNYKLLFLVSNNTVIARKYIGGTYTDIQSVGYNANTYKFFRIREANGTTYWDTSSDGTTWTNFTSIADPFDESVVRAGMLAGTWQTEATTTSAIFDNFNVAFTLPTASLLISPTSGNVPVLVSADASSSTPGTDAIVSYTFDFGDGTIVGPQIGSNATHTYTAGGNYTVTVTVKDAENNVSNASQSITLNTPPTANANGPYTFTEGSTGILTGSATDADNDPLTYAWDLNNDGIYDVTGISTPYSAVDGPATQTVVFRACDTHNACTTNSAIVSTTNATPVVGTISVSPTTVQTNLTATASAPFTDAGILDTHTATVNFGDGSGNQSATVSETNGSGTVTKSHVYTTAGTYTITVTVTDNNSDVGTNTKQLTVNAVPTPTPTPSSGIQLDGTIRATHNSGGNITLSSVPVNGSNANRFLLVAVGSHQGGGTNGASSVKYGGVSMNRLASKVGSFGEFVQIWGLKLPSGGTANIVTSGISGGDFTFIAAYSLYNVKQTYAVSFGTKSQSSNASSISILPFSANNWIIDAIEAEPIPTVSGSNIQDWSQDGLPNSYDNGNGSRIVQTGGPTSVTMKWNLSYGARSNQAAVALEPF